ncbi:MAG: serine hydrolase [Gemmatimonadetes bacterium]|nr:MAG: serine hydrolase [Gemmatimonadota bacterium]
MRGPAHRTLRLRHQAAARRIRRALSLLQPADTRHLVVALVLTLLQGAVPPAFDSAVLGGIQQGVYPGAVLVVGRHDTILFAKGYGHLTWSPTSPAVSVDSTFWDVASLTKVVATTPALMLLLEQGKVSLDSPVVHYLAEFKSPGTSGITVRHLLTHTSGLRATLPLREAPDSAAALRMVLTTVPVAPPGTRMVYSDLNAILLGEIVRHVSGQTLDAFVTRAIYAPLGLDQQMLFRPPKRLVPRIAPTNLWRGHPIAGVVNDPSAGMLGGVSGNAGVFATARGLARFAQFMLNEGALPDRPRLLKKETVHQFTQIAVPARRGVSARTLGWEALPTGEETSSAGTIFGPHSFGHTGWTGTSLWIDPDRDLFVLLLTNRAYAPRVRGSFTKLKEVRGRVADAAARAIDALGR